ncbi:hypothetical protein KSS87_011890, partial [Heliosperma pusillum]
MNHRTSVTCKPQVCDSCLILTLDSDTLLKFTLNCDSPLCFPI